MGEKTTDAINLELAKIAGNLTVALLEMKRVDIPLRGNPAPAAILVFDSLLTGLKSSFNRLD